MKYSLLAALIAQSLVSWRCATAQSSPSCKDENGNDVDWFTIYKLPHNTLQSFNPTGGKFAYVDDRISKNGLTYWPLSNQDLFKAENNPVANTLRPLYEKNQRKDILYFVYNDQPPEAYKGKGKGKGHSKGVVLFDDTAGVWLLHTVPKFMEGLKSGSYKLPDSAKDNGQMFMCVTFKTKRVEKIAKLLLTENAKVYDHQLADWMKENTYPEVERLARKEFVKGDHKYNTDLESNAGQRFRAYAKAAKADTDLFAEELHKDLKERIAVQSWMNGRGKPHESSHDVSHIAFTKLKFAENHSVTLRTTVDHSKWAFTVANDIFCFASTNHKPSQENRGGEALCFNNPVVKALFCSAAAEALSEQSVTCSSKRPRSQSKRGHA